MISKRGSFISLHLIIIIAVILAVSSVIIFYPKADVAPIQTPDTGAQANEPETPQAPSGETSPQAPSEQQAPSQQETIPETAPSYPSQSPSGGGSSSGGKISKGDGDIGPLGYENPEVTCDDVEDNDEDTYTDCADDDCDGVGYCEYGTELNCSDGQDNDADSAEDCADADCTGIGYCEGGTELTCNDGQDNDGDGSTDCEDNDCDGYNGCEYGTELTCNDVFDNDVDFFTDCADDDCDGQDGGGFTCEYETEVTCDDTYDNDVDYQTDCDDSDCENDPYCICGSTITADFTLPIDIDCSGLDGIIIGADDITLDCDGYSIIGDSTGTGIVTNGYSGILIKNCDISYFYNGIYLYSNSNNTLANNSIHNNSYGIWIDTTSSYNNITGNNISFSSSQGIYLPSSENNTINYNNIYNNSPQIYATGATNDLTKNYWGYTGTDTCFAADITVDIFPEDIEPFLNDTYPVGSETYCPVMCGDIIDSDAVIETDLDCSSYGGDALTINANDITLDCAGKSITGGGSYYGISVNSYNNVTIKNCNISSFNYGINLYLSNYSTVTNNTVSDCGTGIALDYNCLYNTVTNNTVTNSLYNGVTLQAGSDYNTVNYNNLYGNSDYQLVSGDAGATQNDLSKNYFGYTGNDTCSATDIQVNVFPTDIEPFLNDTYPGGSETYCPLVCGGTITKDRTLTADLDCSSDYIDALEIGADDITFDCNGFSIIGVGAGEGYFGINAEGDYYNITIKNCNVTGFDMGISIVAESSSFINNTLSDNLEGIHLDSCLDNTLADNTLFSNSDYDFVVTYESTGNKFYNNIVGSAYPTKFSFAEYDGDVYILGVESPDLTPPTDKLSISNYINVSGPTWLVLNITYDESDASLVDQSTLKMYHYEGSSWVEVSGSTVNPATNVISANLSSFSDFGGFGDPLGGGYTAVPEFSDYAIVVIILTAIGGFFVVKRRQK